MKQTAELIAKLEDCDGRNHNGEMTIITSEIGKLFGWHRVTPSQLGTNKKKGGWIAPEDWLGRRESGEPILDSLHGTTIYRDLPAWLWSFDAAAKLLSGDYYLQLNGPRKYLNIPTPVPNYWSATLTIFGSNVVATGWGANAAIAMMVAILKAKEDQQ